MEAILPQDCSAATRASSGPTYAAETIHRGCPPVQLSPAKLNAANHFFRLLQCFRPFDLNHPPSVGSESNFYFNVEPAKFVWNDPRITCDHEFAFLHADFASLVCRDR